MDRYSIEKRDRELVERFRAKVELKEQQKKRNRLRMAAALLVVVCAGLVFFYNTAPTPDHASNHTTDLRAVQDAQMHKSQAVALVRGAAEAPPAPQAALGPPAVLSSESSVDAGGFEDAVPVAAIPAAPAGSAVTLSPDKPVQPDQTAVAETLETPTEPPVFEPRASLSDKAGLSKKPAPVAPQGGVRIAGITVCQDVQNKQPVSPKITFSLAQGAKPYVWMDVRSEKPPFELRHVYYLNDRRYCVVPLDIRYPRMRTWSTVSLAYPTQVGKWRVDVETREGEILSRTAFSVVP
jgi:hypothetical protein